MMKSGSLDYWRNYFRTANSDIFAIIDHAIIVAASDCPKEFRLRRDRIAERLFSSRLTRCSGCNRVELAVAANEGECDDGGRKRRDGGCDNDVDDDEDIDGCELEGGGSKESKVNSSNRDDTDFDNGEVNVNDHMVSNYSYGEAEALTDEIEEQSQVLGEVLRIKDILLNNQDESDSVLFESLRRLQLMALTVETLKATEIGKAVNVLRKHGSKQIRHLARVLIDEWKILVDEWYDATKAFRGSNLQGDEGTPESMNPSVVEEEEEEEDEGLPSPPLDEGAFFAPQTSGIELSQFFDGMDDFGNPRNSGEFIKNHENGRKPSLENHNITKRKQQTPNEVIVAKDNARQQMRRQEAVVKTSRPSDADSCPRKPPKPSVDQKVNNDSKMLRKTEKVVGQRKPPSGQQDKFKCPDEVAVQMKLEVTKRKLHERYQQAENAKRQRTIQVMELHDLPKQGLVQKNSQARPGSHNRHWAHGRR